MKTTTDTMPIRATESFAIRAALPAWIDADDHTLYDPSDLQEQLHDAAADGRWADVAALAIVIGRVTGHDWSRLVTIDSDR